MAYVYRHIRIDKNEPFYIGIGKTIKRAYSKKNRNIHWKRIVNKTEYQVDILFDNLSWEQAYEKEKEFISFYGRRNLGTGTLVNLTDGGEGTLNLKVSDLTKSKNSALHKGNKYRLGHKISNEHKLKVIESNKKRIWSDESKKKLSLAFKGKKIWNDKPHPFLGKKLTEEHKTKIKKANFKIYAKGQDNIRAKKINQFTINNEFIKTWGSSKCIERELDINSSSVIKCCKGKLKTTKGFKFTYAN